MTEEKHVVVTGASSGIGRAIAKAFDQPGNRISLVARREPLLRELQSEIQTRSEVVVGDLSDAEDPLAWLRQAEEILGPTDVLINNAGVSFVEPVEGVSAERIAWKFQVNLLTPIAAIQHVMQQMLERGQGHIINICSVASLTPRPYFCHYTASKGALANFSEALRVELADRGVQVTTVYPGPVDTPMGQRNFDQFENPAAVRKSPTGDTSTLANLILRAMERKHRRVIYPGIYKLNWFIRSFAHFLAERSPAITGDQTPRMSENDPSA